MKRYRFIPIAGVLLVGALWLPVTTQATHIRAADIKVEPNCTKPRTFRITVIAYLNSQSATRFGTNSEVFFGDGQSVRIPLTIAESRPDLGPNISIATFTTDHTYVFDGAYTINYIERDRSSSILNIANSADVPYVTSVAIVVDAGIGCNHFPVLAVPPLDRACLGVAFLHSPGAYDIDGDSLSYEMSIPKNNLNTFADYTSPVASRFYLDFNHGNENKTGTPVFFIGAVSGVLTWDAPGMQGEYNIAFHVIEWRKDSLSGAYKMLSTTIRDMQIVVEECDNIRPEISAPADLCVEAGTAINELILGTDHDLNPVKIEVYSELLDLPADQFPASYSPSPPQFVSSDPSAELHFNWNTTCQHVRSQPYQVVFKITDNPERGPKLVNFKVWNIKVLAPAPKWENVGLNLVQRSTELSWNDYACSNASKIQIWRKVDSYPYTPGICETGLPKFLGYSLIAQVAPNQTAYIDNNAGRGLVVGAKYCYRIMAYFNAPASTPSIVSTEQCIGPILADAPVITHVSIENTSADSGKVRVSWRSPFNISEAQFPKPYEYEIYRARGFAGDTALSKSGRVTDTTFVDTFQNTEEKIFNYRVVLYAKPNLATPFIPIDTSAVAATVKLAVIPGIKKIQLQWRDSVPWSNVVPGRPYHLIYRGIESANPTDMILIDSVNVVENGFTYEDTGRYTGEALEDDLRYSYRIMTRGTYGNPAIRLQENFSQVVSSFPENKLLPCEQLLSISLVTCDEYLAGDNCDRTEFSNTLYWKLIDKRGCRKDIAGYNIYAATKPGDRYQLIASNVKDTRYTDDGLPSFARCYKVSAVDQGGIESILSDSVCNDNCPYYLLPNVFTPNSDGYNDTFNANFDRFVNGQMATEATIRCPRFVAAVSVKVYNRWGKEVYHFQSDQSDGIAIDWDGRDRNGHALETGIYFYSAHVTFNVLDPAQSEREIKGWIHLMR